MAIELKELEKAYQLKIEGYTWQVIEDKTGIKSSTLRDNLKKEGFDLFVLPKNKKGKGCKVIQQDEIEKAISLKKQGLTLKEVSNKIGHPVHKLRAYNIHLINPEVDRVEKYPIDLDYFKNIDTEDKAYYLGLLAADGSISTSGIKIELHYKDLYILEKFRDLISPTRPIYKFEREGRNTTYSLEIRSKYLKDIMEQWNIIPRKSFRNTSLPNLSEDMMPHFIRGYFDGDGSVYKNNNTLRIKFIGNTQFITELHIYLKQSIKIHQTSKEYTSYFTISTQKDIQNLYDYMYSNATIYLRRKKKKFDVYYYLKNLEIEMFKDEPM